MYYFQMLLEHIFCVIFLMCPLSSAILRGADRKVIHYIKHTQYLNIRRKKTLLQTLMWDKRWVQCFDRFN